MWVEEQKGIKISRIFPKINTFRIANINPKICLNEISNFNKHFKKPRGFGKTMVGPYIKITLLKFQNVNPMFVFKI